MNLRLHTIMTDGKENDCLYTNKQGVKRGKNVDDYLFGLFDTTRAWEKRALETKKHKSITTSSSTAENDCFCVNRNSVDGKNDAN